MRNGFPRLFLNFALEIPNNGRKNAPLMDDSNRVSDGGSRGRRRWGAAAAVLLGVSVFGVSPRVWSQGKPTGDVRATVVAIDGEDLVIDLGASQGATEGAIVEIWRPVKLRHPVSGKLLEDRFRIGELKLGQVRPTLSLAQPSGELTRPPEKGDLVIMAAPIVATPSTSTTTPTGPTNPPTGPANPPTGNGGKPDENPYETKLDADAQAVVDMFDSLQGADLVARIRKYEEYVRKSPNGRYARVLYEEAAALRKLVEGKEPTKRRSTEGPEDSEPMLRNFEEPKEVLEGAPLELVVQLSDDATGALLHFRRKGEPVFETINMGSVGPAYWGGRIPTAKLLPPEVEYFIEATSTKGVATAVVGGPGAPKSFEVVPVPKIGPPRKVGANAMLTTDYADYNRLRGNDWSWQTEGVFGLRYDDVGVRALRTGFGVFRGKGGSLKDLDVDNKAGRPIGLTYGYLETELGIHRFFSIIGRGAIGLQDRGVTGGGQIIFRIGSDEGTNLLLGGELLGRVGLRGFTQLQLNTLKKVPILIRTEVTNQPAGSSVSPSSVKESESTGENEVGVRTIVQVGYRFTPDFMAAARISFQGRTIDHAGPGFGGAVGYTW